MEKIKEKIKVVLIEDSAVALKVLQRLINSSEEVEVVGTAMDGAAGLQLIERTQPDVICTDLQMLGMDGLEFTKEVMKRFPRPILVISGAVQPTDVDNIYNLMQAGAMDFLPKPTTSSATDCERLKTTLVTKIRALAKKGFRGMG